MILDMCAVLPHILQVWRRAASRRSRGVAVLAVALVAVAACSPTPNRSGAAGSVGPSPAATQPAADRPNIVFVLTDDLSNNLVPQMPRLMALERAGTTFSHYYVVDSLCCPSRTAIFTGEYPHDDGVYTNGGPFGGYHAFQAQHDSARSFVRDLKVAGYTTGFMGKYLNGYRATDSAPQGWDTWDGVNQHGYQEFNYRVNTNNRVVHFGRAPSDYLTNVLSRKAGDFISNAAASPNPFFLEVATFAPHRPYVPDLRYRTAARGALYPATPAFDAQVKNPPPWLHHRRPLTKREMHHIRVSYQRRVEDDFSVDNLLGHIETTLRNTGVAQNTYIVFSSDNGLHMGEYRLLSGKQTAFDTDINVPLVIKGPQVPAGATVPALASSIDLAPTFDALAGAPVNPATDGVSLLPILYGRVPSDWQRSVLIEHRGPNDSPGDPDAQTLSQGDPPSYEAVRTLTGLFVTYIDGAQEYYDTTSDPYELDNLGGERARPAMEAELSALESCHDAAACQRAANQR
jgi:N-acetylglucosamine-6-sulfatase